MPDFTQMSSLLDFAMKYAALFSVLAAVLLALLVWRRTQSNHMLMARLWRIFGGKEKCPHPLINSALSDQTAVMQFRFMTGIPVRTVEHAERLIAWTRQHGEDIARIPSCGTHFDLEACALKPAHELPKRGSMTVALFALGLITCLTTFALSGVFYNRAILQMKDSKTWFTLGADYVQRWRPLAPADIPGFSIRDCSGPTADMATRTGFSHKDMLEICGAMRRPDSAKFIETAIDTQRPLFALVGLYLGVGLTMLLKWLSRAMQANAMSKRLRAPR